MSFETRKDSYTPGKPYAVNGELLNKMGRTNNAVANVRSAGGTNAVRLNTINGQAPRPIIEFGEAIVVNTLEICSLDPQSPAGARQAPCPSQHLYRVRIRSYNYTENRWVTEPRIYDLDAGALFEGLENTADPPVYSTQASQGTPSGPKYGPIPRFQVGDTLTVRYDAGRGAWLPVMPPVPDATHYSFEISDPGESDGIPFEKFAEEPGQGEDPPKHVAFALERHRDADSSGNSEEVIQYGTAWQSLDGGIKGPQTISFHGHAVVKKGDRIKLRFGKSDGLNESVYLTHARLSLQFNFRIGQADSESSPSVTEVPTLGGYVTFTSTTIDRKGRFSDSPEFSIGDDASIDVEFSDPKDEQTVTWQCDLTFESEISTKSEDIFPFVLTEDMGDTLPNKATANLLDWDFATVTNSDVVVLDNAEHYGFGVTGQKGVVIRIAVGGEDESSSSGTEYEYHIIELVPATELFAIELNEAMGATTTKQADASLKEWDYVTNIESSVLVLDNGNRFPNAKAQDKGVVLKVGEDYHLIAMMGDKLVEVVEMNADVPAWDNVTFAHGCETQSGEITPACAATVPVDAPTVDVRFIRREGREPGLKAGDRIQCVPLDLEADPPVYLAVGEYLKAGGVEHYGVELLEDVGATTAGEVSATIYEMDFTTEVESTATVLDNGSIFTGGVSGSNGIAVKIGDAYHLIQLSCPEE